MKKLEDEIRGKRQKKGKLFLFKKKKVCIRERKRLFRIKGNEKSFIIKWLQQLT